jgi:CheY-like chemotaxis protein
MIAALNPKRYRVEHIHDVSEALLRARIVLAHAIVLHGDQPDESVLRDVSNIAKRVTPVFVSRSPRMREMADQLDARYVPEPLDVPTFKRAIYRAVSKTQDRRHRSRTGMSSERERPLVLLLHQNQVEAAVMAAVLRTQLGATCEVATSARDALDKIIDSAPGGASEKSPPIACLLADPELLMSTSEGATIARSLARAGVPVVPLNHLGELDVSAAGQIAWDIAPQVRRSMTARKTIREAG